MSFQPQQVRSSTTFYRRFNLVMGSSPGFASAARYYGRPIKTRFRYGCIAELLTLATYEQLAGSLNKRYAVTIQRANTLSSSDSL